MHGANVYDTVLEQFNKMLCKKISKVKTTILLIFFNSAK
jgi:hypothetical protein